ncbi:MAG: transcriptional regulator [Ruminiclostridium sp.]|nr:transcriptional regulator [Ruminiclostridium sp.]
MKLDQIPSAFQSRLRLSVIAALLTGPQNFRALQDLTGATPGNLGKQLELLEGEGYIQSKKEFVGRRPNTTYTLLPFGRDQFAQYVALLESVLAQAAPVEEEPEPEPLPQGKQAPGFA